MRKVRLIFPRQPAAPRRVHRRMTRLVQEEHRLKVRSFPLHRNVVVTREHDIGLFTVVRTCHVQVHIGESRTQTTMKDRLCEYVVHSQATVII